MITRHDSLEQALGAIETRELTDLRADDSLSSHYVEVRGREDGPSLSTEQPL